MRALASIVCAVGAVCGAGYYILCIVSARAFVQEGVADVMPDFLPPVSILKPLKGMDPQLYESFRSHCAQDYGAYEIIFGVSDLQDAAVGYVHRLQAEFPHVDISLVECPVSSAPNRKVGNLAQMLPHAKYDFVLVNDSDVWVSPQYLRLIMSSFADRKVGMVTAPYFGVPSGSLWSRIEAIGIATDFIAGVLAARKLEGGIRFGLGSTLAMSREALNSIGGFEAVAEYLADDYELGARIAGNGFQVVLSHQSVKTFLPDYSFRTFWSHQLRWARGIRDARKKDYLGLGATFGVSWALLAVGFAGASAWSLWLLAGILALRMAMAWQVSQRVLCDPYSLKNMWLVPLRDCVAMAVWVVSFFGDTIVWRGERFRLRKGKLIRPS